MAEPTSDQRTDRRTDKRNDVSVGEVVEYVKTYAKQETIDPIKRAGRWLGVSAAAAVLLGVGLSLVVLGLLRLLQTEWDRSARGSLSWLSYTIALAVCVLALVVAFALIKKSMIRKETK